MLVSLILWHQTGKAQCDAPNILTGCCQLQMLLFSPYLMSVFRCYATYFIPAPKG